MSLWEAKQPAVDADVVRKFTTLAESSPRGVEGIGGGGAVSSPLAGQPEKKTGERITELAQYFFKEVVARAITYMQHDYVSSYRVKHLVWALEQFAKDVRQQQTPPPYLQGDGDGVEDEEEEVEWTPSGGTGTTISNDADKAGEGEDMADGVSKEDEEDEDEEAMQELIEQDEQAMKENWEMEMKDEDIIPYAVEVTDTSTPNFDEIFPPVDASAQCISISVLAKTWNETGQMYHRSDLDVRSEDVEEFNTKLNGALNAYVATMLLEPRQLDAAFAKVDA